MSAFLLNKDVGDTNDPNLADISNPTESNYIRVRAILSTRFASLTLLSDRGDVAIYRGRDLSTAEGELVSVKVLHDQTEDSGQRELFRLEAFAATKLSHRNIIRSSAAEVIDGVHFSVLEHRPDAETLKSLLNRKAWLDLGLTLGIVHQIACALEYAHSQGVLHLRIHPENILIDPDGTALLGDFGLEARDALAWAHTQRSERCPVYYISPEQANGESLDFRSDLYSLGIVLYQVLTDRLPINSDDPYLVKEKHVFQSPLAPHLYCTNVPISLSAVISRLLEKDPNERFQDVASFQAAMESSVRLDWESVSRGEIFSPERLESEQGQNSPIDLRPNSHDRMLESWESPSITAINAPLGEVSAVAVEANTTLEKEPLLKPINEFAPAEQQRKGLLLNALSNQTTTRQWGPAILRVLIALAAIVGLLALAYTAGPKSPDPILDSASPVQSSGIDVDPGATPASDDPSSEIDQTPNTPDEEVMNDTSASPGGVAAEPSAGGAVRSRPPGAIRSSTSLRLRRWKRKWVRPAPYWRQSRDARRKYY